MTIRKGPQKRLHIIIGTPDEENCPICKAHAGAALEKIEGAFGEILVQELSSHDLQCCPCPLCAAARHVER